jgi:hypothetical protein
MKPIDAMHANKPKSNEKRETLTVNKKVEGLDVSTDTTD